MNKELKLFPNYPTPVANELCIRALGISESMNKSFVRRTQGTGDYLFMMFWNEVKLSTLDEELLIPSNSLVIWEPSDSHFYGNEEIVWSHSWLHCDGSLIKKTLKHLKLPTKVPIRFENPIFFDQYLLNLYHEVVNESLVDPSIVRSLIEIFLRKISNSHMGAKKIQTPSKFQSIKEYLVQNYDQSIQLEELAEMAHYSVPNFCVKFKEYFGDSPINYLLAHRLKVATYLLTDTQKTISQISNEIGYEDEAYFSRIFKKRYGASPRNWQKSKLKL
ncbi:MAG: hypothetical protein COA79_12100 [Planctomycetota bacterium]|nr:MAG: hypothetical protein COA79_12100 [Planctomycetota bacterium]